MTSRQSRVSGFGFEAPVAMLVVGEGGCVLHANAAAHRLLGYAAGSLQGVAMHQLAPDSERAALVLVRAAGENGAGLQLQSRALRADGRVLDVRLTVEPCGEDPEQSVDVFVSYQPLAPWEARRADNAQGAARPSSERLAG